MAPDPSSYQSHLSLFQQTLLENDEVFYKTFPAARIALDPNHTWRPHYQSTDFAGCGFQLEHIPFPSLISSDHPLSQSSPNPPSSYTVEGIHVVQHPAAHFHTAQLQHSRPMDYSAPHMSQVSPHHESLPNTAHSPLHVATSAADIPYPVQYHHTHQQVLSSPVMDSLSSPESSSDPSNALCHTPPQQVHYNTLPFNANSIPSPIHRDTSAPLTPPALVPAAYIGTVKSEPEQLPFFSDPLPSPQHPSSVPPSRRNSQQQSRSLRRYSPHRRPSQQTHKSGGNGGVPPITVPNMGWPPTPSPTATAPSAGMNVNVNVGASLANAVNNAAVVAAQVASAVTAVPTSAAVALSSSSSTPSSIKARPLISSSSQVAGASNPNTGVMSGKRNPDKKPALACVFCRGRKIACGPPLKDGDGKTCNQCQRRSLRCEYPTESRRGMRKKPASNSIPGPTSPSTSIPAKGNPNSKHNTGNPKPNTSPDSPKVATNRKR